MWKLRHFLGGFFAGKTSEGRNSLLRTVMRTMMTAPCRIKRRGQTKGLLLSLLPPIVFWDLGFVARPSILLPSLCTEADPWSVQEIVKLGTTECPEWCQLVAWWPVYLDGSLRAIQNALLDSNLCPSTFVCVILTLCFPIRVMGWW